MKSKGTGWPAMAWFDGAPAEHEVEVAIAIEVRQGGQSVITDGFVANGEIPADEVMTELEVGGGCGALDKKDAGHDGPR